MFTVSRPLALALIAVGLAAAGPATAKTATYQFVTIDNPNDPHFNQLLGINDDTIMCGYDGDGTKVPNKGYVVVPPDHFSDENFPDSAQTQVVGISDELLPTTVGFWVDGNGNNFGFVNAGGTFTSVTDPNTGTVKGIQTNQLLGINAYGQAVGFYNDSKNNSHGYIYDVQNKAFTEIQLPFAKVVSFQATGINDAGVVTGFYVVGKTMKGFIGIDGEYISVTFKGSTGTALFGLNNSGQAVGSYTDSKGESHGLVELKSGKMMTLDDPGESAKAAFGVTGTALNGVNYEGTVVGFFSDGKNVNGFVAFPQN